MEREVEYLPAGAAQSRTEIPWSAAAPSPALGAPEAFLLLSAEVKMQMWGWVGTNLLLFLLGLWIVGHRDSQLPSHSADFGHRSCFAKKMWLNQPEQNRTEKPTPHLSPGASLLLFWSGIQDRRCFLPCLFLCDMSVQRWGRCPSPAGSFG